MINPDKVRAILAKHRGKENIISATRICLKLGLDLRQDREVRRVIKEQARAWSTREEPFIVCGVPGLGYFVAQDIEEAQATADWLFHLKEAAIAADGDFRSICRKSGLHLDSIHDPENRAQLTAKR